jgi:hypothetical protein
MYKNIQINQEVTFQGSTLSSCYLVINQVGIAQISNLIANYRVLVYESKLKYETNKDWRIKVNEIQNIYDVNFSSDFNQGDLFEKISSELKTKILSLNPTWLPENVVIEA